MNLPIAPVAAVALGALVALGVAAMPAAGLESLVADSGLPSIVSAAQPPLGLTARLGVAALSGGFAAIIVWLSAFILVGTRSITLGKPAVREADGDDVVAPVLRRADAHPDAPPRPPLLATRDLGAPFAERPVDAPEPKIAKGMPVEPEIPVAPVRPAPESPQSPAPIAEQALPRDLDQPLSAFDPNAIPDVPMPPPIKLPPQRRAPRTPVFAPTERFEVFELTPPVRIPAPAAVPPAPSAEPIARPETEASVHALLERLERGVVRRGLNRAATPRQTAKQAERGLEDALATLRNMARQA